MELMKYKEQLCSFLDMPRAKLIIESEEFYFEKAIDKYILSKNSIHNDY
ncbi:hypothetical protein KQI36_10430 [Clostridium senegalense]|nr:hypothetical protein [Clostridium senegalense]MBU5227055.1 hypothetical protein [Clostridium senegalense]